MCGSYSVAGTYYDANGVSLLESGGTLVLETHDSVSVDYSSSFIAAFLTSRIDLWTWRSRPFHRQVFPLFISIVCRDDRHAPLTDSDGPILVYHYYTSTGSYVSPASKPLLRRSPHGAVTYSSASTASISLLDGLWLHERHCELCVVYTLPCVFDRVEEPEFGSRCCCVYTSFLVSRFQCYHAVIKF